ncbi:hypothetical protein DUI87_02611 [Hirundo rustica rustica]|uniref:ribonuclease H n=1 Tax=Hirundo rustica rustica TaxID=333673 RepID=A0A3M0L833_HIRRU|nr:hypothetical protein DUI87_02611 [Hirundo rustica rustica]
MQRQTRQAWRSLWSLRNTGLYRPGLQFSPLDSKIPSECCKEALPNGKLLRRVTTCSWNSDPGDRDWKLFLHQKGSVSGKRSDWERKERNAGILAAATEEHPTKKLNWKTDSPVWVEQWPLSKEKLKALQELVDEQLAKGHIVETTSLWNSPVFVIKKANKGKWQLLHDLCQINNVIEDMGSLQPRMPCPAMLPQNWNLAIIDIKDCFFQIPLHPDDAPCFAFLVPTLNREAPRKRYHWKFLPQGMKNSPFLCQWYLSSLLSPVRAAGEEAIILHYMDDVLVCAPNDDLLSHALDLTIDSLVAAGFELQEEKVQRMLPWMYLGLEIGEKSSDAMKHLIQAFSFLGIPKSIKTDNGPTYTSKEVRSFLQQWGVQHKTGIPYSPTDIDFLRNGYYKDAKGFRWAFGIAAVEAQGIKKLNSLPGLLEITSAAGLLKVEEQRVPVATSTVHRRQYRKNRDAVIPMHKMIRKLETQGVASKTHSSFNSPIWPVCKSDGERKLTVDYRALNEVTPPLSAAVPDMLELQYELESKAAKWWKHSPTICHGLIQAALEKGEAPEHLQYIYDIIVWGNTAMDVFEKGEKIMQILLKAGFAIKQSKVKGPVQEIQFLGVKWQDGWRQIPTEAINKITAMSPPTSKKETQAFLGAIRFWRMHIPEYRQIVSPLYLVTRKKNDFHWGPEQQQAFAQIKQEIAHAVALGPVRMGPEVKNVLYSAAGNNGLSWSLWQKVPGETRGRPLGFWSRSYRGSKANYTPTEKEILTAYEGVQAASEVIDTEAQLLLAPRLPVLGWRFKGKVPSTHHATDATWSKWIALITQRACIGNPNRPGILEIITNWPEGENFSLTDKEEQEQVTRAEEGPPYNQLPAEETRYALFTDGSCRIVGMNHEWEDIATQVEKLPVKVRHVDAHVPKSRANEEHRNNMQVIHDCETCAAIKQAKRVKPLWYGGRWSKYKYGEAWQIDYITLPQTRQGKRYVLAIVETTTGWLETYPVPHATAQNTILGLEKQILWRHGTPERIESDNGTHFKNSLINTWAREHGIEWVYHIPYHAPAAGKVERCNSLIKTTLKALGGGTFKNWEINLAKAT